MGYTHSSRYQLLVSLFYPMLNLPAVRFNGLHTFKSISTPCIAILPSVDNKTTIKLLINHIVDYLKKKKNYCLKPKMLDEGLEGGGGLVFNIH